MADKGKKTISLKELLGDIAHDLRIPITPIRYNIELVQSTGPLNEKQLAYSERALEMLQRMEQMVNRLLDLLWLEADPPLKVSQCDLSTLVGKVCGQFEASAARRGIKIHLDLTPPPVFVEAEEARLEQVIVNLVSNAIKYNRDNGSVYVTVAEDADDVRLIVRDTGNGIAPEVQSQIWDRFYRAQSATDARVEGAGLGLSIVRSVVEKHGGTVDLESAFGSGATFTITLPRRQQFDGKPAEPVAHLVTAPSPDTSQALAPAPLDEVSDPLSDQLQEGQDRRSAPDQRDTEAGM